MKYPNSLLFLPPAILLLLSTSFLYFGLSPLYSLLLCLIFTIAFAVINGTSLYQIALGIYASLKKGLKPGLILALVGVLVGSWMASGVVPLLTYYGLLLIHPNYFVITAFFFTIIVSSFTGSSFTTVGTIGAALLSVAHAQALPLPLVAGAIVSGACFGDKMSPLSDTTNFAAAIADVDLYSHIAHMTKTTLPAVLLAAIIYLGLGSQLATLSAASNHLTMIKLAILDYYTLSPILLISPALVFLLSIKRVPILWVLITGIISALILAICYQQLSWQQIPNMLIFGNQVNSSSEFIHSVYQRGGLLSMLPSISLILVALSIGGVTMSAHIMTELVQLIRNILYSRFGVIFATAGTSVGVNLLIGEQYLSVLLPGEAFKETFDSFKIERVTLSRTLEDAGTLINALVPWGVSGLYFSQVLTVPVIDYLPYAIYPMTCIFFTLLFAWRK